MDNIHCWVLPCFQSVLHAAGTAGLSRPAVYRHFNSRKNSSCARTGCCDRLNYRGFRFKKEVQAVIIYVNAHYMDKLTLDGIADYVGLNREYLSRLFSKETGTGLFQYINEVRMKRAGEMIRSNKQVYIKEVAAAVGFDDPYFFSRKFKDFYGKTPSEYAEA